MDKPILEVKAEPVVTTEEVVDVETIEPVESDPLDINEVRSAMGLKPKEDKPVVTETKPKLSTEDSSKEVPVDEKPLTEEEYDEIVYNKETIKIPVSERKALLQKGYNYDKQHDKLSDYEVKVKELESLLGMNLDTALEKSRSNRMQEEIDEYSEKHNVTPDEAKELIEKDKRIKALEFKEKARDHKDQALAQKKELANELYFKELEPEIDGLIQENIDNGQLIDVDTAYRYLLGTRAKELLENSKKETEKRTLANVQDRAKRTVQKEAGSETQTVVISDEAKLMAREMGVSLTSLKKRLAKRRSD